MQRSKAWATAGFPRQKGERIAVIEPDLLASPIAFLGIVRAGVAQVNVNPLYTPRELG